MAANGAVIHPPWRLQPVLYRQCCSPSWAVWSHLGTTWANLGPSTGPRPAHVQSPRRTPHYGGRAPFPSTQIVGHCARGPALDRERSGRAGQVKAGLQDGARWSTCAQDGLKHGCKRSPRRPRGGPQACQGCPREAEIIDTNGIRRPPWGA